MLENNYPKYYRYLIIYKGDDYTNEAILRVENLSNLKIENYNKMHLIEENISSILSIFEYCLHLPRNEFDVCDTDTIILDKSYDTSHDIIFCPDFISLDIIKKFEPDLIFCDELCFDEINYKVRKEGINIECVSSKDLSNNLLSKHWNLLFEKRNTKETVKVADIDVQYLLVSEKMIFLPTLFNARQYGRVKDTYKKIFNSINTFDDCAQLLLGQIVQHNALMACVGIYEKENLQKTYNEEYQKALEQTKINLVITAPGVPSNQIKYGGISNELPEIEKKAIRIMGIHRAISKNALMMEIPIINYQMFTKLNQLEIYCKQEYVPNNKYVHKTLDDISRIFEKGLTHSQKWAIDISKQITVFSNFPLGLYIPNNTDTTLQCQKEVSSRPLSPLTRNMQIEFYKRQQIYLGKKCNILFVECVPNTKENKFIRECSDIILKGLENINKENKNLEYVRFEAYSVNDLKKILNSNNAHILIISAHGFYKRERNMSGLMIGNEEWMVEDNDCHVSPIVILSACHVSPRGNGCVNAADLFFRIGAETVLSTFVPIRAHRNAILITRLITYVSEAQKGSNQYRTLSEAWAGVASTNAILEMAEQSSKLKEWIMGKNIKGKVRWFEFGFERSKGRLRVNHIYEDTRMILKEMLNEEHMEGKFSDILDNNNYFPESFFYQWIGYPENIFLYNEVFLNFERQH